MVKSLPLEDFVAYGRWFQHETLPDLDGRNVASIERADNGFDVLYVSGGIHARDYGDPLRPDPDRLAGFLATHGYRPVAVIARLQ